MSRMISDLPLGSLIYIDETNEYKLEHVPYIYLGIDESGNARVLRQYALADSTSLNNISTASYLGCKIDLMLEDRNTGFLSRFNMATYNALVNTTIKYSDYTDSTDGTGTVSIIARKCFLLSYSELGYGDSAAGNEGKSYLDALIAFYDTDANHARICRKDEHYIVQAWTRSASDVATTDRKFYVIHNDGTSTTMPTTISLYCRPALSIISTTLVSDKGSENIYLLPEENSDTITVLGDAIAAKEIIEKTIEEYVDHNLTRIGSYAFANCENLSFISCPAVESISASAFASCYNLGIAIFQNATNISTYCFASNSKLRTIIAPNILSIPDTAFYSCINLTDISFPHVTTIGFNAVRWCTHLKTVFIENATTISNYAFANCYALTDVHLEAAISFLDCAFWSCSSLSIISFPNVGRIGSSCFAACINLEVADFPMLSVVGANAFNDCSKLSTLFIGTSLSSICRLQNSNAFTNASLLRNIYVPSSLVESYKTATNWTYFSSIIYGV